MLKVYNSASLVEARKEKIKNVVAPIFSGNMKDNVQNGGAPIRMAMSDKSHEELMSELASLRHKIVVENAA